MRRTGILWLLAAGLIGGLAPPAAAQIEAREAFMERQDLLVRLAGHFGALHRLDQLCGRGYEDDRFRKRMREIVPLEVPMGATRLDMVEAFNTGYRNMSRVYLSCSAEAAAAYESEARESLSVVDRLARPFQRQRQE
ncbi:hypothetical protein PB2503_10579 [Parvularcula bermudensis HTCC2503]|uniref:TIGR02301 family protein n=1 Tax=Parvularcula bermudensis (strain ATCC BAA-594 / HTCC2503 / KCTC 12087) TaxID=314260 RepID=E0TGN5_PARBH|nr:TIGR02301 family protein [Parvularcula bermudensis]ADM10167.1 hypothetical protein PB2503_10579 [Parvularcula bermudensis HTCC2503]